MDCTIHVRPLALVPSVKSMLDKKEHFATYRAGQLNSSQIVSDHSASPEGHRQTATLDDSRMQRGGLQSQSACCDSKARLESLRTENEHMVIKVRDLESKLQAANKEGREVQEQLSRQLSQVQSEAAQLQCKLELREVKTAQEEEVAQASKQLALEDAEQKIKLLEDKVAGLETQAIAVSKQTALVMDELRAQTESERNQNAALREDKARLELEI